MKKDMNHKMKLVITLAIGTLFLVTTVSSAGLLELNNNATFDTTPHQQQKKTTSPPLSFFLFYHMIRTKNHESLKTVLMLVLNLCF
jgi:hypothetical protein